MRSLKRLWNPRLLVWPLGLLLVGWALRSVPVDKIWDVLARLSLAQLLALVALNLLIVLLWSSRWWQLLRAQGYRLPFFSLVGYRLAGFGISYFTPGPQIGGEPLQVHLISRRHAIPASAAIVAVSLDKLLDLLANFTFIALSLLFVIPGATSSLLIPIFSLGLILPAAYLLALRLGRRPLARIARLIHRRSTVSSPLHRVYDALLASEEQMAALLRRKPLVLLQVASLTLLVWALMIVEYRLALSFLGQPASWSATIYLLAAARIAFLLPSPGALGTLEASQVLAMQAIGFDPALALSLSLLIRARDLTLGGLGLWLGAALTQRSPVTALPSPAGD